MAGRRLQQADLGMLQAQVLQRNGTGEATLVVPLTATAVPLVASTSILIVPSPASPFPSRSFASSALATRHNSLHPNECPTRNVGARDASIPSFAHASLLASSYVFFTAIAHFS